MDHYIKSKMIESWGFYLTWNTPSIFPVSIFTIDPVGLGARGLNSGPLTAYT